MAISDSFNTQQTCPIPENLQSTAFEKQLCDIVAAIAGGTSILEQPLNPDTVQDFLAERLNTAQEKKVNEGVEKKDYSSDVLVGPKVDLGQKNKYMDCPLRLPIYPTSWPKKR